MNNFETSPCTVRDCPCTHPLPMQGAQNGLCACGHGILSHRPDMSESGIEIPARRCPSSNSFFVPPNGITRVATLGEAGALRCSSTICHQPYFAHRLVPSNGSQDHSSSPELLQVPTWMQPGTFSDPARSRGRQLRSSTTSRRSTSPSLTRSQGNSTTQYHQPTQSESSTSLASPPASRYLATSDNRSFTNQNRMEAAIRHRSPSPQLPFRAHQHRPSGGISMNPFGTLPTITVPRDTARENRSHRLSNTVTVTQPSSQSRRSNLNLALSVKYIFCINPAPYHGYIAPDNQWISSHNVRFPANSVSSEKPRRFVRHARTLGLAFTFEKTAHGHHLIAPHLTAALQEHMESNRLSFNQVISDSPSSPVRPSSNPDWHLLYHKQTARSQAVFPICHLFDKQETASLTYSQVQEIAAKFPQVTEHGITYTVLLLVLMETVPRERIIVGPLNRAGIHFCLSSRLWHGFQTPNPLEINDGDAPECIEYCVLQDEEMENNLHSQLAASNSVTHPSVLSTVPHTNNREVSPFIPPTIEPGGLLNSAAPPLITAEDNPLATLHSFGGFIMPVSSNVENILSYLPSVDPEYYTLSDFGIHIDGRCHDEGGRGDSWLHLEGNSVPEAAEGLVDAIKSVNRSHFEPFSSDRVGARLIRGSPDLSLGNMFSVPHWMFRAGLPGRDAFGSGVLREVLMEAINLLLLPERGLVQDTGNGDGYLSLKTSSSSLFVSNDTLNNAFALGVLCAFFMLKCHSGPDPVSPVLLQAAIGGVDSIVDFEWIEAINPDVAKSLSLLPTDPDVPIPEDNQSLRILIASKMDNFRFSDMLQLSSEQRPALVKELYCNVLLGIPEDTIVNAKEFREFRNGFNLHLGSNDPSLIDAIKNSSKQLLYSSYNRQLRSPFQLLPYINYIVDSSNDILAFTSHELLSKVERMVARYLLGKGHPFPDRVHGLVSDDLEIRLASDDQCYRARRFIKVLSGLPLLPSKSVKFLVKLKDIIPQHVTFGTYDIVTDCIPPTTHACLYSMDIWVNEGFYAALDASDVPLGQDTEFDWMMHSSLLKIGDDDYNA